MMEYDRAIFLVYYLESVYGKPWVENGELQYTAQEIQAGMDFMTKLEEAHVIPTIATLQGDMADSLDKNAKVIDANTLAYLSGTPQFPRSRSNRGEYHKAGPGAGYRGLP